MENLFLYIISFILIWVGSGLIVSSVSKFSKKLGFSPFAFSFIFLGLLTSTPEFSVGLQAVANHDPEIFIGNLLGGVIVLFLIMIPLLAILGNGVSLRNEFSSKTLLATMVVIAAPSISVLDQKVTSLEGVILIIMYLALIFFTQRKGGIFDQKNNELLNVKTYSHQDLLRIIVGLSLVFISSHLIVDNTIYFAHLLNVSTFYISLLVVALGTDLPELSLALRSVFSNKKDVAMGDYIGAATASTPIFGTLVLLNGGEVLVTGNFLPTFLFITAALGLFYIISRSQNYLSRKSGLILLAIYLLFVAVELIY